MMCIIDDLRRSLPALLWKQDWRELKDKCSPWRGVAWRGVAWRGAPRGRGQQFYEPEGAKKGKERKNN